MAVRAPSAEEVVSGLRNRPVVFITAFVAGCTLGVCVILIATSSSADVKNARAQLLETERDTCQAKLVATQALVENLTKDLEGKKRELDGTLKSHADAFVQKSAEVSDLTGSLEMLRSRLESIQSELAASAANSEALVKEWERERKQLRDQVSAMSNERDTLTSVNSAMKRELESLTAKRLECTADMRKVLVYLFNTAKHPTEHDIARFINLSPGMTSLTLSNLTELGYITTMGSGSSGDKSYTNWALTQKGREYVAAEGLSN